MTFRDISKSNAEKDILRKDSQISAQERVLHVAEIEKLRNLNSELNKGLAKLHDDLKKSFDIADVLREDLDESRRQSSTAELTLREQTLELDRVKAQLVVQSSERDGLLALLDQQNGAMKMQARQTNEAFKMLHEKQVLLENFSKSSSVGMDEFAGLQADLQSLLDTDGTLLHSELVDSKKLTSMISVLRDRVQQGSVLRAQLEQERVSHKNELEIENLWVSKIN